MPTPQLQPLPKLLAASFALRIAVVAFGLAVDVYKPFGLAWTDVDYVVLRDGAAHLWQGHAAGPYARATFRYAPAAAYALLADVVTALPLGKALFAAFDIALAAGLEQLAKSRGQTAADARPFAARMCL
mmetsp:Transcript_27713/g.85683  ORF Transcript_27713/g.85683 Transcript_27713/m.85683 type:complete len:129 (-) Transcript_27713:18-404(-)